MWHKLRLRTQLVSVIVLMVIFIEGFTLFFVFSHHKQDKEDFANNQIISLTESLNKDFLQILLSPTADNFADLSSRIAGFQDIKGLKIVNKDLQSIFVYKNSPQLDVTLPVNEPLFFDNTLHLKKPIISNDYIFGYSIISIDLQEELLHKKTDMIKLALIFLITILFALLISLRLSKYYTKPFATLVKAMAGNDIDKSVFNKVVTSSKNEVGELFAGYNTMLKTIKTATTKLKYDSEHDHLTGAYNRFFIENKIKYILKQDKINLNALVLLDIDKLDIVNNTAGYMAGDYLLKMIAVDINSKLPDNAIIARVGGDDFYLLFTEVTEKNIIQYLQKMITNMVDFRFSWKGEAYSVSLSAGLVLFKPQQCSFNQLIKALNTTFYKAKSSGLGKLVIFSEQDNDTEAYNHEIKIFKDIKESLKKGSAKFELFAQAIVPLQNKNTQFSYEILIRMWGSQGDFVPPDQFLPIAERFQLMVDVDIYVLWDYLETVISQTKHLEQLGTVHINVAGSTFNNAEYQQSFKRAVNYFDFPWHKLNLEITETSAVGSFNQAKEFITYLQGLNVGLALDDFGTGMSSFEYLKKLPFNKVKIDGSFIKGMHKDPSDQAVIRYIQEVCALRNQETIAEHVETEEDLIALTKIRITYGQGYFLGKPKPLTQWL